MSARTGRNADLLKSRLKFGIMWLWCHGLMSHECADRVIERLGLSEA